VLFVLRFPSRIISQVSCKLSCFSININKSFNRLNLTLSAQFSATYEMVDGVRKKSYFRNWWMTTGAVPDANPQVPVRDEAEEVNAVIDLIEHPLGVICP
jgi:hypothetical protein